MKSLTPLVKSHLLYKMNIGTSIIGILDSIYEP